MSSEPSLNTAAGPGRARSLLLPALAVIAGLLWIYVIVRASDLSFTADESITYSLIHGNAIQAQTANDQWLNTWLMRAAQSAFGGSEFALRLPNVLSFGIYAAAGLSIIRRLRHPAARILAFAGLFTDPFAIEFFGLARGYGLSIAFLLAAFAALLVGPRPKEIRSAAVRLALVGAFADLAFYANFSVLNVAIALILFAAAEIVVRALRGELCLGRPGWLVLLVIGLAGGLSLYPGIRHVRFLERTGELYYGGATGTVHDTFGTLAQTWGYVYSYGVPLRSWAVTIGWVTVMVGLTAVLFATARGVRTRALDPCPLAALVLLLSVAGIQLEHWIEGTLFPIDRVALGYLLAFVLAVVFAVDELAGAVLVRRAVSRARDGLLAAVTVFAALAAVNLVAHLNTTSALTWDFDQTGAAAVARIVAFRDSLNPPPPTLVVDVPIPRTYAIADYYAPRLAPGWMQVTGSPVSTPGAQVYDVPAGEAPLIPAVTHVLATFPDGTELRVVSGVS